MNKKQAIEELKKYVEDSIKLYEQPLSSGFEEDSYRHRMFNEIIKAFEDPLTLADILGWEEGAVYRYNNKFFKIKHGLLVSSLTREEGDWCVDWTLKVNNIFYLKEAIKVEPKKYYLRHRFLDSEGLNYLNYRSYSGEFCLLGLLENCDYKTKFTDKEIEEIEASGFNLRNFERVEVEDE